MEYLTSTSWFGSGRLTVLRQVLVTGRYFLEIFLVLLCGAGLPDRYAGLTVANAQAVSNNPCSLVTRGCIRQSQKWICRPADV